MRRVLVPLDGSPLAARILPDAQRLAGPGGEVVLMHDVNRSTYDPATRQNGRRKPFDEARTYLEALAEGLRQRGVKAQAQTVVFRDVALSVDEAARIFNADMIACATHGRGPVGRLVRGGVAWKTLAHSAVPVTLRHFEKDEAPDAPVSLARRRIMLPIDGSPLAERAVSLAATLAQEWDAQLFLVRVISTLGPSATPFDRMYMTPTDLAADKREAQRYFDRVAGALSVEVHACVLFGGVIDSLSTAIEDLSITDVVMASHGRTGLSRVIAGSVADALVQGPTCPIIIVPALAAKQPKLVGTSTGKETVACR